jgi:cell division protein FtsQ
MWQDVRLLNMISNALLGILALALLSAGLWWGAQQPVFTLKTVRVVGAEGVPLNYVNHLTVRNTALPRIRGNFFTVELETVRRAFEALPWVRRASVKRQWPNQLLVTIEEHRPLGTWGDQGQLVSVKGDVFIANLAEAEERVNLSELSGPAGSEKEVVARYSDLRAWLSPIDLAPVGLQLSERYAWTALLDNGVVVELGREWTTDTLRSRVERLVGVYPQLAARLPERIEKLDLRYRNGLAVKAKGWSLETETKKSK